MGSHSYLVNLQTNIGDLHTSGLLNSHASRDTTTNVGHLHGDRTSVISLGELHWYGGGLGLQELGLLDHLKHRVHAVHFTKEQAAKIEAAADKADSLAKAKIDASAKLSKIQKELADKAADAADAKVHSFVDAHTDAAALQELYCGYIINGWRLKC